MSSSKSLEHAVDDRLKEAPTVSPPSADMIKDESGPDPVMTSPRAHDSTDNIHNDAGLFEGDDHQVITGTNTTNFKNKPISSVDIFSSEPPDDLFADVPPLDDYNDVEDNDDDDDDLFSPTQRRNTAVVDLDDDDDDVEEDIFAISNFKPQNVSKSKSNANSKLKVDVPKTLISDHEDIFSTNDITSKLPVPDSLQDDIFADKFSEHTKLPPSENTLDNDNHKHSDMFDSSPEDIFASASKTRSEDIFDSPPNKDDSDIFAPAIKSKAPTFDDIFDVSHITKPKPSKTKEDIFNDGGSKPKNKDDIFSEVILKCINSFILHVFNAIYTSDSFF